MEELRGGSAVVAGAHLRVELDPVLERLDAELPLAAHPVPTVEPTLRPFLTRALPNLSARPVI